jgi:S1-C subfamily serine protease
MGLTGKGLRCALAVVVLAAVPSPAPAQTDSRSAAREIVRKWQDAIVNVRVTLKLRMSMAGREMNASDDSADTVGTVIDPSGLTVLSLGALNPGATMNKIIGAAAQSGQDRPTLSSEPTDVKIRIADGRELPAKIVLRDEDLDLAFLMPTTKLEKPLVAINLEDASRPSLLDEVVVLSRLGRVGGWTPSALLQNITAIIDKPRTFFVAEAGAGAAMGTPAFLPNGKVVGLMTLRSVDPGRPGMMAMMGTTEGLGLLAVILPAADVLEVAKQATGK